MATHRSLNKLEFKAHMSIHNMVDVPENESHDTNYTRDRFGKRHRLKDEDGASRIRTVRRAQILWVVCVMAAATFYLTAMGPAFADPAPKSSTDIQVVSGDIDELWGRDTEDIQDEEFTLIKNGDTALGFNEDGDPALTTRF